MLTYRLQTMSPHFCGPKPETKLTNWSGIIGGNALDLDSHTTHSGLREQVLEHLFLGELLRCLWRQGHRDIEVLKAEVDNAGYDLVIECNGIMRHIQLKSSYEGAKTNRVKINTALTNKPSGCVIWMVFDPKTVDLGPFYWFGGSPGRPLPSLGDRVAKHTKGDAKGGEEKKRKTKGVDEDQVWEN